MWVTTTEFLLTLTCHLSPPDPPEGSGAGPQHENHRTTGDNEDSVVRGTRLVPVSSLLWFGSQCSTTTSPSPFPHSVLFSLSPSLFVFFLQILHMCI